MTHSFVIHTQLVRELIGIQRLIPDSEYDTSAIRPASVAPNNPPENAAHGT